MTEVDDAPTAAELRRELAAMRVDVQSRREVAENWYITGFGVVLVASMVYAQFGAAFAVDACATAICRDSTARSWVAVAGTLFALGAGLRAVRVAGPVGADPARLTWLHSTPVDRRGLLGPGFGWQCGLAGAAGAAAGILILLVQGGDDGIALTTLAMVATAGAACGLTCGAVATRAQTSPHLATQLNRVEIGMVTLAGLVGVGAVTGIMPVLQLPSIAGLVLTVMALLAAVVMVPVAVTALRAIPSRELRRGGEVQGTAVTASLMMDPSVVATLAQGRRHATSGRYPSRVSTCRPSRRGGWQALVAMEAWRLRRRPLLVAAVLAGALPAGLTMVFAGEMWGHLVAAVVAMLAGRALAGGVAAWCQSSGLRRLIPLNAWVTRGALVIPAVTVLTGWAVLVVVVGHLPWWAMTNLVCAGLAALLRAAEPVVPADFTLLMTTPAGALPIGLVRQVADGVTEAMLCVLAAWLAPAAVAIPVALVVVLITAARASWK